MLFALFLFKFIQSNRAILEVEKRSILDLANLQKELEISQKNCQILEQNLQKLEQENSQISDEINQKIYEISSLRAKFDEQVKINLALDENLEKINKQSKEYFDLKVKQMSDSMLNLNSKELSKNTNLFLKQELEPLKNRLENYEKELIKNSQSYKTSFDEFAKYTKDVMQKADNLAKALLGNKKTLGNWGEVQLDLTLQNSGLVLGSDYEKQVYYKDKDGKQKFIDVLVHLPENKNAIIDAKVSLVNYTEFCNTDDEGQRQKFGKALANDLKNHIDILSSKDYVEYSFDSYDYAFMFVPNDAIFYVALEHDRSLYQYAYEKMVFITTPLTLLMALKTISLCYKNMQSDKNAIKILNDAGAIYDKFVTFCEYFAKIESGYQALGNQIDFARKNLQSGSGNLVKKVENLRELGAKNKKQIPQNLFEADPLFNQKDEYKCYL